MTVRKRVKSSCEPMRQRIERLYFYFNISSKMNSTEGFSNTKFMSNVCFAGRKAKGGCRTWKPEASDSSGWFC